MQFSWLETTLSIDGGSRSAAAAGSCVPAASGRGVLHSAFEVRIWARTAAGTAAHRRAGSVRQRFSSVRN